MKAAATAESLWKTASTLPKPSSPRLRPQSTVTLPPEHTVHLPPSARQPPVMSRADMADSDSEVANRSQQSPLASRRKQQEEDTSKRPSRFAGVFPLGYKEGFSQWWSSPSASDAEHKVLSYIPYLQSPPTHTQTGSEPPSQNPSTMNISEAPEDKAKPITTNSITDPYGPRTWHSRMVPLSGKNRALNEFSVERTGEQADQNLVILHGYGAGLGFFYKNFEALSRPKGWHLYALDMLGMGRSSRPAFKIHAKQREDQIREAEDWFIDSLEEWRKKKNIDKMTLVGHSMGGYMAVCYALKYPGRLNKLILASPVGIPEDPYAVKADMPEPPDSTMANEFTQDQQTESIHQNAGDNNNFLNARSKAEKAQKDKGASGDKPPPRKPLPKWLTYLWDANISPFSLVRWSGPLGPRLVSGWTSRRFSHLPSEEATALHDYSYSLFRLRGSGEYALAYILAPGAFARSPLIRRISGVGRKELPPSASTTAPSALSSTSSFQNITAERKAPEISKDAAAKLQSETGIPVVLMYGENDWMDVKGGHAAAEAMNAARRAALKDATEEDKRNDKGSAKVVIIPKAGHHVYLDNAEHFNKVLLAEMEEVKSAV